MQYTPSKYGFYSALQEHTATMPTFDASRDEVLSALRQATLSPQDFARLLSPHADTLLELIAKRAQKESLNHFGKAIQLFAPLYLANICTNRCVYCGFHANQKIKRKVLTDTEIEEEAKALAMMGLRRVLVLTGDAPKVTGARYIANAIHIVSQHVPSVGIEVQALTEEEYSIVCMAGADSLTMFQETYNEELYASLHLAGPKRNFGFRLDAPERAIRAGFRSVTFGSLLGLSDWRKDIYFAAMHAYWISRKYPHVDIAFSLPRIRPKAEKDTSDIGYLLTPLSDKDFVKAFVALKCFLPHACITVSSRENPFMRDHLIPLGATRLSAGVMTSVGGYATSLLNQRGEKKEAQSEKPVQFVIDDSRSVSEMAEAIKSAGYQPVFADWTLPHDGNVPLQKGIHDALGLGE